MNKKFLVAFFGYDQRQGAIVAGLQLTAFLLGIGLPLVSMAEMEIVDDVGNRIQLQGPAKRIVSLAPHITELLFAIGAGDKLAATVEHSDYPLPAKSVTRIGRHNALDLERILLLKPDLIIAWQSGNPVHQVSKLQQLGLQVFYSEPRHLLDIGNTVQRFGQITGLENNASAVQQAFLKKYLALKKQYAGQASVRVFYEIWNQPLMTVNGDHIINEVIELCGGVNVFANLTVLAPTVNLEAVIEADPQVIIASGVGDEAPPWLSEWQQWPHMQAVKQNHIYHINPDIIHRQTVRLLAGAQRVCEILQQVRGQ